MIRRSQFETHRLPATCAPSNLIVTEFSCQDKLSAAQPNLGGIFYMDFQFISNLFGVIFLAVAAKTQTASRSRRRIASAGTEKRI
jgi:hypothetical protein